MDRDEPIGLLIAAVRRRIRQAVGSHVRRYRLSIQQFWILVAIAEQPGCSLGELAAHLRMDKPTASRVVFTLMKRKLVQVRGDAADRRRACLTLSPAGAALAKELRGLAAAIRGAVVQGLSPSELAALRLSLRKVIDNMDRFRERAPTAVAPEAGARARQPSSTRPSNGRGGMPPARRLRAGKHHLASTFGGVAAPLPKPS